MIILIFSIEVISLVADLKFEGEVAEDREDDEPGQEGGQGVRNAKHQYTINCGTISVYLYVAV